MLAWCTNYADSISGPIDNVMLQSVDVLHLAKGVRASYKSISQMWKVCSRIFVEDVLDTYIHYVRETWDSVINCVKFNPVFLQKLRKFIHRGPVVDSVVQGKVSDLDEVRAYDTI